MILLSSAAESAQKVSYSMMKAKKGIKNIVTRHILLFTFILLDHLCILLVVALSTYVDTCKENLQLDTRALWCLYYGCDNAKDLFLDSLSIFN